MFNSWHQTLANLATDGPVVTNTTTATSLLGTNAAHFVLPSNFFNVGSKLYVCAGGKMSTAASAPGTLTIDFRIGSTVIFSGGASATVQTSASNLTFEIDAHMTVRSIGGGTAATIQGRGRLSSFALVTTYFMPAASPGVGTGFDSTTANYLDMFATWSVASASNSINLTDFELINRYI